MGGLCRGAAFQTAMGAHYCGTLRNEFLAYATVFHVSLPISWPKIASYIEPEDLINLSKSSRRLHSILTHSSTHNVWKSALNEHTWLLPECPIDLNSISYAHLLFDSSCMV